MKKVSITELTRNLSKLLHNLPLEVTLQGHHIAYIVKDLPELKKERDEDE